MNILAERYSSLFPSFSPLGAANPILTFGDRGRVSKRAVEPHGCIIPEHSNPQFVSFAIQRSERGQKLFCPHELGRRLSYCD